MSVNTSCGLAILGIILILVGGYFRLRARFSNTDKGLLDIGIWYISCWGLLPLLCLWFVTLTEAV